MVNGITSACMLVELKDQIPSKEHDLVRLSLFPPSVSTCNNTLSHSSWLLTTSLTQSSFTSAPANITHKLTSQVHMKLHLTGCSLHRHQHSHCNRPRACSCWPGSRPSGCTKMRSYRIVSALPWVVQSLGPPWVQGLSRAWGQGLFRAWVQGLFRAWGQGPFRVWVKGLFRASWV